MRWLSTLRGPERPEARRPRKPNGVVEGPLASVGKDFAQFHQMNLTLERVTRGFRIDKSRALVLVKRFQFMYRVDPATGCWNWTASCCRGLMAWVTLSFIFHARAQRSTRIGFPMSFIRGLYPRGRNHAELRERSLRVPSSRGRDQAWQQLRSLSGRSLGYRGAVAN